MKSFIPIAIRAREVDSEFLRIGHRHRINSNNIDFARRRLRRLRPQVRKLKFGVSGIDRSHPVSRGMTVVLSHDSRSSFVIHNNRVNGAQWVFPVTCYVDYEIWLTPWRGKIVPVHFERLR